MLSYCLTARTHMHTHNKLSNDWAWVCLCIHSTSSYEWKHLTNVYPPWQSTSCSAKCHPCHKKRHNALIATPLLPGFQPSLPYIGKVGYTQVVTGCDAVWQCVTSSNKLCCIITLKLLLPHYLSASAEHVVEGSQHCIINIHTFDNHPQNDILIATSARSWWYCCTSTHLHSNEVELVCWIFWHIRWCTLCFGSFLRSQPHI